MMVYRIIFAPFILLWHSCRVYAGDVMLVYLDRWYWVLFGCCHDYYTDVDFPPCEKSLGGVSGDSARGSAGSSDAEVVWVRAGHFSLENVNDKPPHPKKYATTMNLFEGEVEACDIKQGTLGDCWLLAAMSTLAEHPGMIPNLFVDRELSPRGKYKVRLYDVKIDEWTIITIDDFVPCVKDRSLYSKDGVARRPSGLPATLYARPNGHEIWAMMLEKAVAKLMGSYAALEGGFTELGIVMLTGRPAWRYEKKPSGEVREWKRSDLEMYKGKGGSVTPIPKFQYGVKDVVQDDDGLFKILELYSRHGSLMCCGGIAPAAASVGLVSKHAYSLLEVARAGEKGPMDRHVRRFAKIRNPWGDGEWKGKWSDGSKEWEEYPYIKQKLAAVDKEDGMFWMEWEDFCYYWKSVGVIDCPLDMLTICMPPYEEEKKSGPLQGFAKGCWEYWCQCLSCKRYFLSHAGNMKMVTVEDADKSCGCDPSGCYCRCCQRFE